MMLLMYTRCYPCMYGEGEECPGVPHSWMDQADAMHAGIAWPLSAKDEEENQCNCICAGGPGGCVLL